MSDLSNLQNKGLVTTLYPWEEDLAFWVGEGRTGENKGRGDRKSYDTTRLMADNLLANVHAAVTEIGVSRLLGAYCYAAVWDIQHHNNYAADLPDALWGKTETEIKWRRSATSMPVDRKDAERGRFVLWAESKLASRYNCVCQACHEPITTSSKVRLLGGGNATDLWEMGTPYNGDENRRKVEARHLTSVIELL
jgi:hypothetical protein